MGQQFYERTMPKLVKAVDRLADNLERQAKPVNIEEASDPGQALILAWVTFHKLLHNPKLTKEERHSVSMSLHGVTRALEEIGVDLDTLLVAKDAP